MHRRKERRATMHRRWAVSRLRDALVNKLGTRGLDYIAGIQI
jgi:hypothetical protein